MTLKKKIFLSSTALDLESSRKAVLELLAKQDNYELIAMEHFGARNSEPLDHCLSMVRGCDIFVALVGHRHGSCPPDSAKSFSELEHEEAVLINVPRIVFMYDGFVDSRHIELDEERGRQNQFRNRLRSERIVGGFRSPEEIAGLVSAALSNLEFKHLSEVGPRTVLLFPFATSTTGFNTALAISNVGPGPGDLNLSSGVIVFYFYGTLTSGKGGPLVSTQQTSKALAPGQVATMNLLFGGPEFGIQPLVGFQGFVYAICEFPHARGFCHISDPSNIQTATGYLAEVVPQSALLARTSSSGHS